MRFIGDVHGDFQRYRQLIAEVEQSVQVGDMGIGFCTVDADGAITRPEPPFDVMEREGSHRFIRGNQDDPGECRAQKLWIEDGHAEGDMFFCGGAKSANPAARTEGLNWWPDEELSPGEFKQVSEKYLDLKPGLMITHDCPHAVADLILSENQPGKSAALTQTRQSFQAMWQRHEPDIWIFGHWHLSMDKKIAGTRFVCLNLTEAIDL